MPAKDVHIPGAAVGHPRGFAWYAALASVAAAAGSLVLAGVAPRGIIGLGLAATLPPFLVPAAAMGWMVHVRPTFVLAKSDPGGRSRPRVTHSLAEILAIVVGGAAGVMGIAAGWTDALERGSYSDASIWSWMLAACTPSWAVFASLVGRREARLARALVDAPPLPAGAPEGTWGSVEGRAIDRTPTVIAGEPAAFALVTDVDPQPGSDPDIRRDRLEARGGFAIDAAIGEIGVEPEGALLVTTAERRVEGAHGDYALVDLVPIGAPTLVAGRVAPDGSLRATGPESLLVAATPGDDPRRRLSAFLFARRVAIVAALVLGAVSIAATAVLSGSFPEEAPEDAPGTRLQEREPPPPPEVCSV